MVDCRQPLPSRVSGSFRTRGVHLTGRGRRGAPELPLVKMLGVADRTPGVLNGPKQAALGTSRPALVGDGAARQLSIWPSPSWPETGGELVAVRDQLSMT